VCEESRAVRASPQNLSGVRAQPYEPIAALYRSEISPFGGVGFDLVAEGGTLCVQTRDVTPCSFSLRPSHVRRITTNENGPQSFATAWPAKVDGDLTSVHHAAAALRG